MANWSQGHKQTVIGQGALPPTVAGRGRCVLAAVHMTHHWVHMSHIHWVELFDVSLSTDRGLKGSATASVGKSIPLISLSWKPRALGYTDRPGNKHNSSSDFIVSYTTECSAAQHAVCYSHYCPSKHVTSRNQVHLVRVQHGS